MSLQPSNTAKIDRSTTAPFLLRLYWRQSRPLEAYEFAVAPPQDTSAISDYSSLLPASIRQQSVQIYTWPTCTLSELTGLLSSVLPENVLSGSGGSLSVGTRLVYKLIFADTRGQVSESGKGKWVDRALGSVIVGSTPTSADDTAAVDVNLEGDAEKTLADARFVIGDYIACTIYPPGAAPRGPPPRGPPMRENGFDRGRGGYRGGYGGGRGGGGFGAPPPPGDWRRGDRPGGGYGGRGGGRLY